MFKKRLPFTQNRIFKFFATIRFAIPVLFTFAAAMSYGTVIESMYGTEYVHRAVYDTWWFYLIQASIAVSVIFAVLDRIPFRKRLVGFYIIHAGLVVIMIGAVVTSYYGIDGSLELNKGEYQSSVRLAGSDLMYVEINGRQFRYPMPKAVKPENLNLHVKLSDGSEATMTDFFPYAKEKDNWKPKPGSWVSDWNLKNDRFEQTLRIGNDLAEGVESQQDMGPLHVEVVPEAFHKILMAALPKAQPGFIFLNIKSGQVKMLEGQESIYRIPNGSAMLELRYVKDQRFKVKYYELKVQDKKLRFFPDYSALPLSDHFKVDQTSEFRLIGLEHFKLKNSVYLSPMKSGEIWMTFGKAKDWGHVVINPAKSTEVPLPWMGFKMRLISEKRDQAPSQAFEEAKPNKEDEKNFKAALVKLEKNGKTENLWVTNRMLTTSELTGSKWFLGVTQVQLPLAFALDRFKMDVVPGTKDKPASYESFAKVKDLRMAPTALGAEKDIHVYMNNPYKAEGYTFYQSSFFQDDQGEYHSVFSVNKDPGRPVKYAGALILIFGMILHFSILYGKIKV